MEGLLHYINPAHAISLLSALNEERLKGQLCDVVLIVGDQKFRAHKNVLAASSEYFQTLFTKKENESQSVFQLDFCEPDTFDNVLNYIYSSSLFVEKSSLAGVQEVGYSLGISFLTNIVSRNPQVPLPACPIKKILFQEEDESSSQKRSVIVCQSKNETQEENVGHISCDISHNSKPLSAVAVKSKIPQLTQPTEFLHSLSLNERRWLKDSSLRYSKSHGTSGAVDDQNRTRRNAVLLQEPFPDKDSVADESGGSNQLLKGKITEVPLKRPCPPVVSLCNSSESTFLLRETGKGSGSREDRNLLYYSKLGLVVPSRVSGPENQSIDRSGPLVKSLLRRSLSMDSQVPLYSPSFDLKLSQASPVVNKTEGTMLNVVSQKTYSEKATPDDKTQGNHERLCRNATVCIYCSLRFSSLELKHDHEITCEYKKLTCLECMRTFKSSFSIWRHQVEVHNQNSMAPTDNFSLPILEHNGEVNNAPRLHCQSETNRMNNFVPPKEDSDSSEHTNFDSEDSSCLPEDLSISKQFKVQIKEEPADDVEEEISEGSQEHKEMLANKDSGLWPCEKCGKIFTVHKQLERHQELLCSVKPFICHVCNKAFRTNFRLWSHFQSHMAQPSEEPVRKETEICTSAHSPSPPPLPPPPPLPKIQPLEPDSPTALSEATSASEKLFVPQESDTLFYHAPPLSAITFKRQYMCKLCHRTFKTAFSLWSHEQTHN
ncbi:zinc finger and BTB domain-containing protein 21 isoform X2 [Anolis carolinensis]|uniref:zinc finger and BTB domain-containing protein 21 isoform X2 n=1 Tax=Anolis carolinensis TaxID=28377 RepID=UPI0004627CB0|nr:PREDICTED: zinc finger and BTB domain-containing protein 21 isoform X2 [Anolis carolinensis]|eukprot:XP_008105688.1 PREDICTED: zinc finger and BTB domain-containing protein 21 isoform X2 [Anolis carolinensis]